MSHRASLLPVRRYRRSHRWPLLGACLWLFVMTLLGAELAAGELPGGFPDEGQQQGEGRGRTAGERQVTGL